MRLASFSPTSRSRYVFALSFTPKTITERYPVMLGPSDSTKFRARVSASSRGTLKLTDASGNASKKCRCAYHNPTMPASTHRTSARLSRPLNRTVATRASALNPRRVPRSTTTHSIHTRLSRASNPSPRCVSSLAIPRSPLLAALILNSRFLIFDPSLRAKRPEIPTLAEGISLSSPCSSAFLRYLFPCRCFSRRPVRSRQSPNVIISR